MTQSQPTFPPLLTGHCLKAECEPMKFAVAQVASGKAGAGDLFWSEETNRLRFALVLEPDVSRSRCPELIFVAMVALGDAAGALIPPEVSITYQWPGHVLMNDARIGFADLQISDSQSGDTPDWMVLSVELQMMPDFVDPNPGENVNVTTMWDEGCGDITRDELLESVSRHTVALIHTWSEDGFAPIHKLWTGRLFEKMKIAPELNENHLIGLDETGNALVSRDGQTVEVPVKRALQKIRDMRSIS